MNADPEMSSWRAEWRVIAPEPQTADQLRRLATKQQNRLRTWQVGELAAALIFLVFSGGLLWRNPVPEVWLWAAIVWASTFAAIAFSIWNWRNLWSSDVKSVTEFIATYKKRCLATLRALRFGLRFLAVQLAISVPWLAMSFTTKRISSVRFFTAAGILTAFTACLLLFGRHYRRAAQYELDELNKSQESPETLSMDLC